jgi:hypothetical protein
VAKGHGDQYLSDEAGAVPGKQLEVEMVGEPAGDLGVRPAVVVRDREPWPSAEINNASTSGRSASPWSV